MKNYITVSVSGSYMEEFINNMRENNIMFFNLKKDDGVIYFNISPGYYKQTSRIAAESKMTAQVTKRHGIYFRINPYKKRYGIIFGALGFLAVIVMMSNFIWDVKVTGNEAISAGQVLEIMEAYGIKSGVHIKSYNKEMAELAVALELDSIAWVNIERDGSRIYAKVSERTEPPAVEIPPSIPANIIASVSGQIISTEVYRGTLMFTEGSGVNNGDIIVSGIVSDGAGGIILSHASAKIIAECEEKTELFIPFTSTERKKDGRITKNKSIIFLGKAYPTFIALSDYENTVYSEEIRAPKIFGLPLPYRIKTSIYTHYEELEVTISQSEALARLNKQIRLYLDNFYSGITGNELMSVEEVYKPVDDGIGVELHIVYRKDIAQKKAIGMP